MRQSASGEGVAFPLEPQANHPQTIEAPQKMKSGEFEQEHFVARE